MVNYLDCGICDFSCSVSWSRLVFCFVSFCVAGRGSGGYDTPGGGGVGLEVALDDGDDGLWLECSMGITSVKKSQFFFIFVFDFLVN